MIGPTTNTRVDVGINAKTLAPAGRLRALPATKLCPLEVTLTTDDELMSWIRTARDEAARGR